ncbi:DedA family protein [Citricoccus sp. K5]|uniref:DedA family protein n=1 Tax=Citricoccus sp. K5 TaxID=2653135 RepID=UPI0012F3FDE6|nr:VTT domain-containing protein [Citricoccus sp. K5]VXB84501.1 Membrane protein DedA with SNARE-associated domain [Citricoccus sp. K5]
MMDWIASLPLVWAILLFWGGALCRSTATYALGRGIAAGAEHTALRRYMSGPVYLRAMRFIDRWGPWAIPFCFLTVGIQTAVIATAGVTRMRWRRFIPAALLGSLIWGIIYGTIGMAVVWAVITTALASPVALLALVLVLAGVVVLILWRTGGLARLRASRDDRRARQAAQVQADTTSDAGR